MKIVSALALSLTLLTGAAFATDAPATKATQTASARSCGKEAGAKNLHGDARAKYIKDCKAGKQIG